MAMVPHNKCVYAKCQAFLMDGPRKRRRRAVGGGSSTSQKRTWAVTMRNWSHTLMGHTSPRAIRTKPETMEITCLLGVLSAEKNWFKPSDCWDKLDRQRRTKFEND